MFLGLVATKPSYELVQVLAVGAHRGRREIVALQLTQKMGKSGRRHYPRRAGAAHRMLHGVPDVL